MKLVPEFQRYSIQDPSPKLIEQLTAAIELVNTRLSGHDYIKPLVFVVVIDENEHLDFDVFERHAMGAAKSKFGLSVDEMAEAKTHPLDDHARMVFLTPESRGVCDVRVGEARTPPLST